MSISLCRCTVSVESRLRLVPLYGREVTYDGSGGGGRGLKSDWVWIEAEGFWTENGSIRIRD